MVAVLPPDVSGGHADVCGNYTHVERYVAVDPHGDLKRPFVQHIEHDVARPIIGERANDVSLHADVEAAQYLVSK